MQNQGAGEDLRLPERRGREELLKGGVAGGVPPHKGGP